VGHGVRSAIGPDESPIRGRSVIGPDGMPLSLRDLPPPNTRRWVIRRKAEVVAAVKGGLLTISQACAIYSLTVEEYLSWEARLDRFGLSGLRTTRAGRYRRSDLQQDLLRH
jgi:hypothetical protein